jgi:hypothetical protein
MSRRWIAAAALTALPLLGSGCGAMILHAAAKGSEGPSRLSEGMTRDEVEAKLGGPVGGRKLPDGGAVSVYEYRLPDPSAEKAAHDALAPWFKIVGGYGGAVPAGVFTEFYFFPYAIYKAATGPRSKVTFTYGPDGRLLYQGPPPVYGPPDDAVGTVTTGSSKEAYGLVDTVAGPSIGVIRQTCRREDHDGEASALTAAEKYVDCVSTGLAIWGLE